MQLGASTSLFCLSQYAIPFCTLLAELGYKFGDQWEGVFVLDHYRIECLCQGQTDRVWRNGVIIELYSGMMY